MAMGSAVNAYAHIIQECAPYFRRFVCSINDRGHPPSLELKDAHAAVVLGKTCEIRVQTAPRIDSCRETNGPELAEAEWPSVLCPSPRERETSLGADHKVRIHAFDPGAGPAFQPIVQLFAGGQSRFHGGGKYHPIL